MALGKNMKVEKLIPLEPKEDVKSKTKAKVKPAPLVEEAKEEVVDVTPIAEIQNEEQPTNVDLDAFFEGLDGGNDESVSPVEENVPSENTVEVKADSVEEVKIEETPVSEVKEVVKAATYEDFESETLKIAFKPSRRKTQKRIFIEIEGAMTINNVEVLHSRVNDVFTSFDHVELNMSNITEIDLTVIQLFHTIRMSYLSLGKHVYINAELSREDRKLLNACGFTEFQTQKPASN